MGRHVSHKNTIMTQAREDSLHELVSRLHIPNIDISILDCAMGKSPLVVVIENPY